MRRHDQIPRLTVETAPVYRCGGKRYLSRRWAYVAAARKAYYDAYRCECEHDTGYVCGLHGHNAQFWEDHRDKVVPRLARWIRWRDGRRAAMGLS